MSSPSHKTCRNQADASREHRALSNCDSCGTDGTSKDEGSANTQEFLSQSSMPVQTTKVSLERRSVCQEG